MMPGLYSQVQNGNFPIIAQTGTTNSSGLSFLREDTRGSGRQGELLKQPRQPGYKLTGLAFKVVASLFMIASPGDTTERKALMGGHSSSRQCEGKVPVTQCMSACQQCMGSPSKYFLSSFDVPEALD